MSELDDTEAPGSWGGAVSRRDLLIGGALLAAAVTGSAAKPSRRQQALGNAKLEDLVPHDFDGWRFEAASGLVLPPEDQLRDSIYSQLLTRVYSQADGAAVMLLIAYSSAQDGVIQVHRPEVCYPAGGYRLKRIDEHPVAIAPGREVPSRFIVAEGNVRTEQLIYWTRIGRYFPTRWLEQRAAVARENLEGVIPDGVLVRVSTIGSSDAKPLLDRFAASLYRAVPDRMKDVLIGAG